VSTQRRIGICCYPTYGGSGAVATELGLALAERGHEIHFLSYARPARLLDFHPRVTFHKVSVSSYPLFRYPPYDLALASLMREVAETHALDLVHVHYAIPHAVSAVLAREMLEGPRPRIVTTLHGTDITIVGADRSYFHPTRFGIDKSDVVTTVSRWLRDETVRLFAPQQDIRLVANFVDTERFRPRDCSDTRQRLGVGSDVVLAHVSNFRPVKRVPDAIRVFARVASEMPARMLLAGDGPDRPAAEELARELGVHDRVQFLGEQERVEKMLACADLFLLPSRSESFGLAALEAMACGVPVLGTRSGGLPEVVEDGVSGHLFEVGDVDAAADAALGLLRDRDRHAAVAAAARTRAAETFAVERVVAEYEALYESALL
jgi:N-acetyl-alpha-D-glucosaminyl L-malate synthase BshA